MQAFASVYSDMIVWNVHSCNQYFTILPSLHSSKYIQLLGKGYSLSIHHWKWVALSKTMYAGTIEALNSGTCLWALCWLILNVIPHPNSQSSWVLSWDIDYKKNQQSQFHCKVKKVNNRKVSGLPSLTLRLLEAHRQYYVRTSFLTSCQLISYKYCVYLENKNPNTAPMLSRS